MTNRRQLIDAVEVTDTGIHLVRLKRIFDATSVNEFEKVLAYLLSRQQYRIVVDLTQVEFVASAGWGAFTAEFRNVRKAGGDIRLAGMNPDVQDVFFLLELDSFINAYEAVDEAIASFEAEMPATAAQNAAARAEETATDNGQTEATSAYAHAQLEAAGKEEIPATLASEEVEPAGFEVAEVYEPEYRTPLALDAGNLKSRPPQYERLAPAAEEEEGWVISEEMEADPAEVTTYAAEEDFAAFAPEITFDAVAETVADEAPVDSEVFEEESQAAAWPNTETSPPSSLPRAPNYARSNGEEWPEAQAEENVALEDFELQDIHDPWILEEIDTLPEEGELENAEWNESFEEEPVVAPVKPVVSAPSSPIRPQMREAVAPAPAKPQQEPQAWTRMGANFSERFAINRNQGMPEPRIKPRASAAATPNEPPTLADKVKAASKPETLKRTPSVAKAQSESDHIQLVREIVSEHPHYGPAMIQKFFATRLAPPVQVSRSTVYRWLRLADLNTREQRLAFAGKAGAL